MIFAISRMFLSKIPRVLGFVIISPAVRGPATFANSSRSTIPSEFEGTTTTLKPAIAALAGFVPCAESGTIISVLCSSSFFDLWKERVIRQPKYSPWAPAAG